MKKLVAFTLVAVVSLSLFAQEAPAQEAEKPEKKELSSVWPAFVALGEYPASPDVIGIRFTIPYSTRQENVTGLDLGLWGRALTFEGIQVNILRNDVKDSMSGFQVGLYNSVGRGDALGIQAGLWNESGCVRGVQAGLVNISGSTEGFQIGLINRSETMYGIQVGLINVIRDAEFQFLPVCNIGF